jgi:hypothetical protein
MKRNLVCGLSLVGLLASAGMAMQVGQVETEQTRRQQPAVDMSRSLTCEDATVIDCDYGPITFTVPEGGGEWFYIVGQGQGLTIDSRFPETTADSDLYVYTGACGNLTQVLYRDGDSPAYKCYLNCNEFIFQDGVGYYIYLRDYYGDSADIKVDFTCCEANPFVCPPGTLQYDEDIEFGCGDYSHALDCGTTYCEELSDGDDVDFYWTYVTPGMSTLTINVYGDDTAGQAPFGYGCDPYVKVWNDDCSQEVAFNEDISATNWDSRLFLECLPEGYYIIEVGTNYDAGPYLLSLNCAPCCTETNSPANPVLLTDSTNWTNYQNPENALEVTVNLCDYCDLSQRNYSPAGPTNSGEFWFRAYQPVLPVVGECDWALILQSSGPWTNTCAPIFGVGQNGAQLGYFNLDPDGGFIPSNYNEPSLPGDFLTTFDIDAHAACCENTTFYIWYYWWDRGCPVVEGMDRPVAFTLSQNVPNPFNPTTTISFTLPETNFTTLKVYDLNGSEVATLLDGVASRGQNQVTFDGSQLGSGVYFYTLTSGGQSETQKMVLVK